MRHSPTGRGVLGIAVISALLMFTAAQPVLANRGHPNQMVPFSARFTTMQTGMDATFTTPGAERCTIPPPGLGWFSVFDGQGVGTHIGRYVEHNTHCTYVDGPTASGVRGHIELAEDRIVTANGDVLTGVYQGTWEVNYVTGTATVDMTYQVTGGTGRFAGASGAGTSHLDQSITTGAGVGYQAGWISYDASDRAH
jgi:hypothetical protein